MCPFPITFSALAYMYINLHIFPCVHVQETVMYHRIHTLKHWQPRQVFSSLRFPRQDTFQELTPSKKWNSFYNAFENQVFGFLDLLTYTFLGRNFVAYFCRWEWIGCFIYCPARCRAGVTRLSLHVAVPKQIHLEKAHKEFQQSLVV